MVRKNNYTPRFGHVGKSSSEKQYYKNIINAPQKKIDETATEENDHYNLETIITDYDKGNVLDIQPIKKEGKNIKKNKKLKPYQSFGTKIKKHIKDVIWSVIILGVLTTAINVVWNQQRDIGKILSDLESVNKDISEFQSKYNLSGKDNVDNVILITQIKSDLNYIKERLTKVEIKIGL